MFSAGDPFGQAEPTSRRAAWQRIENRKDLRLHFIAEPQTIAAFENVGSAPMFTFFQGERGRRIRPICESGVNLLVQLGENRVGQAKGFEQFTFLSG